jgi:SAM-dependent methyltransferase
MNNEWYFQVGRSAVENILVACLASKIQSVKKVLDIPCGHGRVLRHLFCLFPGAEFYACDLDTDGVDFCASTFAAKPIYSHEELTTIDFGNQFDLIWVGSLFTHTARNVTKRWLAHLVNFLTPTGILVATFHGRWCEHVQSVAPYIGEDIWEGILKDYVSEGYGYHDYLKQDSHSYITGSYGVSLATPHVIIQDLEDMQGTRIFLYRERGWADHHDVVVLGRPSYCEPWPTLQREDT